MPEPMEHMPEPMEHDAMQVDVKPAQADDFNPDLLKIYYGRLFPMAEMYKWLSYGNDGKHPGCDSSFFSRREFSFTLEHDIYLRYLSFRDVYEMETAIYDKCPYKIDIGAVYNVDPAKRSAYSNTSGDRVFAPVERELVFDIDMTDYDDVRTCCSGADICLHCWPLMTIAIKVIDSGLRDDFGFQHITWVYSGRRGVHCWVCDVRARRLSNEQRASIADYFRVYKGNENNARKVMFTGAALHPSLSRAYLEVLKVYFEETLLSSQNLLLSEEHYGKVLQMIPDESIVNQMRERWQDQNKSHIKEDLNDIRWRQLKQALEASKRKGQGLRRCVEEIVFAYAYPRLDMEVSKHMNHLLKSPFCVHPKTGRVCVPIDPQNCENFDPTTVPTITQLVEELNREAVLSVNGQKDWEKTSLEKPVHFFQSSFLDPLLRASKAHLETCHQAKIKELAAKPNYNW